MLVVLAVFFKTLFYSVLFPHTIQFKLCQTYLYFLQNYLPKQFTQLLFFILISSTISQSIHNPPHNMTPYFRNFILHCLKKVFASFTKLFAKAVYTTFILDINSVNHISLNTQPFPQHEPDPIILEALFYIA